MQQGPEWGLASRRWKEWAWLEPKLKLLHLRDLSCAVRFTQSPALRDALDRSGQGYGFPSGRGLVGGLFVGATRVAWKGFSCQRPRSTN